MRTLLLLVAGAAIGLGVAWLVLGMPFSPSPVTKLQIEHAVAQRPRGHVQLVLCNEVAIPERAHEADPPHTWTCDTYLGRSTADQQNGPSYQVTVSGDRDRIESIRRVPTH